MLKLFLISILFLFTFIGCQSNLVGTYVFERDTPVWLKVKIDSMLTQEYYWGTVVYRYKWKDKYYFQFTIPVSSTVFTLYNYDGTKTDLPDVKSFEDYWKNKTDSVFIWKYPRK